MSHEKRPMLDHSLVQLTIGDVERVPDLTQRINIIDSIVTSLSYVRGKAVLERVKMESSPDEPQEGGPSAEPVPPRRRELRIEE